MVHPPNQTVTAKEGEPLDIVVEFCAEPRHTKVLWMSEESVYVPGAEARDGVQALAVEVRFLDSFFHFSFFPFPLFSGNFQFVAREKKLKTIFVSILI